MATLREQKVDSISTKNIDMKQRRIVNAAPAQDPNDYVTLNDLTNTENSLLSEADVVVSNQGIVHNLVHTFNGVVKFVKGLITNLIYPPVNATNALQVTKADGSTIMMDFDTINSRIGIFTKKPLYPIDIAGPGTTGSNPPFPFLHMSLSGLDDGGYFVPFNPTCISIAGGIAWNNPNWIAKATSGSIIFLNQGEFQVYCATGLTVGATCAPALKFRVNSTGIGFFGTAAVAQQVLNAYTSNTQSSAYTGIASGVGGSPYAQVSDLNALRVAYENLRASYDDLRTKLRTSTLVG